MIVVCGEALIDLFVGRPDAQGISTEAVAGGSPFNLALGLARLGARSAFLSTLSEDAFGDFLLRTLEASGVETGFIRRVPESTTLSVVATGADGQPHYTFHASGADRALTPAALPALPEEATCVAAGSYALGVEPIASAIDALFAREHGRRAISLDPNIRPRVTGDMAVLRRRIDGLAARATIIKASVEDIALLYGVVDQGEAARAWLRRGAALVVITAGEDGATAYLRDRAIHRRARPVVVIDTVGAGDTFHAALLAHFARSGLLRTEALAELDDDAIAAALEVATAAAALTCTRRGADLPTRADLARFLEQAPGAS